MATTSNGDHDGYFKSYVDFDVHRLMIEDRPRTEAYQQAIEKHPDLIKDKVIMGRVVLELGQERRRHVFSS